MTIKTRTTYTAEIDNQVFPIPFPFEEGTEQLKIEGNKATLGVLVRDEDPGDPFVEWEEGEFYQFDPHYIHNVERPDLEGFKRIVRAHPGRVVLVYSRGDGYFADKVALDVCHTKNVRVIHQCKECYVEEIENADGYYIAPDDVTDAARYAKGSIAEYSAFCTSDVWGVCIWHYVREGEEWELQEDERDECWGYYGWKYALETLKEETEI